MSELIESWQRSLDDIELLRKQLTARHNGWISVEDRLPGRDESVLVFTNDIISSWVGVLTFSDDLWFSENGKWPCIVTHWQPLPEPPANKE